MKRISLLFTLIIIISLLPEFSSLEAEDHVAIWSNQIDWNNNSTVIQKAISDYNLDVYWVKNVKYLKNYDKVIVLGGPDAYTDGKMPVNISDIVLSETDKNLIRRTTSQPELYASDALNLTQEQMNTYGLPDLEYYVFAGPDRDATQACVLLDPDDDGLASYIERIVNTNPFDRDTDGDKMNDYFETLFGEQNDGLYDPTVYNGRYLMLVQCSEGAKEIGFMNYNMKDYLFNKQNFNKENYIFMYYPTIQEFDNKIMELSNKITENDFFYLWTDNHGNEGFIAMDNHELLYIDHLEDVIDSIESKATIYQMVSCANDYNVDLFNSDSNKIVSSGQIIDSFYSINGIIKLNEIDKDKDGYVNIADYIQFAIEKPFGDYTIYDPKNLASKVYHGSYNFATRES